MAHKHPRWHFLSQYDPRKYIPHPGRSSARSEEYYEATVHNSNLFCCFVRAMSVTCTTAWQAGEAAPDVGLPGRAVGDRPARGPRAQYETHAGHGPSRRAD